MKLYAIRHIHTKVLVGMVYVNNVDEISWHVDNTTNPTYFEYKPISKSGALWYSDQDLEEDRDEDKGFFPDETFDQLLQSASAAKHGWKPVCPGEVPNLDDDELVAAE